MDEIKFKMNHKILIAAAGSKNMEYFNGNWKLLLITHLKGTLTKMDMKCDGPN